MSKTAIFTEVNDLINNTNSLIEYEKLGTLSKLNVVNSVGQFLVSYKNRRRNGSYSVQITYLNMDAKSVYEREECLEYNQPLIDALTRLINEDVTRINSLDAIKESIKMGLLFKLPRTQREKDMDEAVMDVNTLLRTINLGPLTFNLSPPCVEYRLWSNTASLVVRAQIKDGFVYCIHYDLKDGGNYDLASRLHALVDPINKMIYIEPRLFQDIEGLKELIEKHRLDITLPQGA